MSGDLPEELLDAESELFGDGDEGEGEGVETSEREERDRFTVFRIGGHAFAVPVLEATRVVETVDRTRVPRTADAIYGVMDLRGEITAVIDPWVHLAVPDEPLPWDDQFVVVFATGPDEQPVGIRVDEVVGVEGFPVSAIDDDVGAGDHGPSAGNPLVEAMITREVDGDVVERIAVLDTDAIVDASGRHPHQTA